MKRNDSDTHAVPSAADYKNGVHYQWECEVHKAGIRFLSRTGRAWNTAERKLWIDNYMTKTDVATQLRITACEVCQDVIGTALLEGRDPYACPEELRGVLKAAGVNVRSRGPNVKQPCLKGL